MNDLRFFFRLQRNEHWVIRSNPADLSDSSGTSGLDLITQ